MITYPITFPTTIYLNNLQLMQRNSVARSESPFSFTEQVYDWGGQVWEMSGSLPLMNRETAAEYRAFIAKLNGRKGTFLFPMPESTPRGVATGTPVVDGASQEGGSVNIRNFDVSVTNIMRAGDWVQFGTGSSTRLHMVLDDADSDGSGNASLNIWPNLRTSPADGEAVIVNNCQGLFRLTDDVPHSIDFNNHYGIQFSAMEVL